MRNVFLFFLIPLMISCSKEEKQKRNELKFKEYLGKEKIEMLNEFINSYDSFIKRNYNKHQKYHDNVFEFLRVTLSDSLGMFGQEDFKVFNKNWGIDEKEANRLIEKFENSSLRKEFWIYEFESLNPNSKQDRAFIDKIDLANRIPDDELIDLSPIEDDFSVIDTTVKSQKDSLDEYNVAKIDSFPYSTPASRFYIGIYRFSNNEKLKEFSKMLWDNTQLNPYGILIGLCKYESDLDYDNYFTKIYIVMNVYYNYLYVIAHSDK